MNASTHMQFISEMNNVPIIESEKKSIDAYMQPSNDM